MSLLSLLISTQHFCPRCSSVQDAVHWWLWYNLNHGADNIHVPSILSTPQDCCRLYAKCPKTAAHSISVLIKQAYSYSLQMPTDCWALLYRKLVALFGLAQQLLSRQQHYDWGLRALKTCLAISGKLLHEHRAAGQQLNQVSETQVVIRGVQLATMPKLTFDDTSRCTHRSAMIERITVRATLHSPSKC